MSIKEISSELLEAKIDQVKRTLDLIMIDFLLPSGDHIALHIQSFMRIYKSDKLVVSSEDMCRKGSLSKRKFNWANPGESLFDDEINDNIESIKREKVIGVFLNAKSDLIINLSNDISIEVLVDTIESEEKYRIFSQNKDYLNYWT